MPGRVIERCAGRRQQSRHSSDRTAFCRRSRTSRSPTGFWRALPCVHPRFSVRPAQRSCWRRFSPPTPPTPHRSCRPTGGPWPSPPPRPTRALDSVRRPRRPYRPTHRPSTTGQAPSSTVRKGASVPTYGQLLGQLRGVLPRHLHQVLVGELGGPRGYFNNQTGDRATATYYGRNGEKLTDVPVGSRGAYNWSPVWSIRNCY